MPRAQIASAAAGILKRVPAVAVAAGLYALLSPSIGLNTDGQIYVAGTLTQTCTQWAVQNYGAGSYCYDGGSLPRQWICRPTGCGYEWLDNSYVSCCLSAAQGGYQSVGQQALADAISSSNVASHALISAALADAIAQSYTNDMVQIVPSNTAVSVSASPVTTPAEVVSTRTSPNPDGSTTTTTETVQTTATPEVRGTTAADIAVDWKTATTTTTTAQNNTSGVSQTTTQTDQQGTTTTAQETDLCRLHPEAVACQQLGTTPTDTPLTVASQPLNVTFSPPNSVAGSCPAPVSRTLSGGKTIAMSFQPACDFAGMMRPVILAAAFLGAAFIVSGSVRVDS